MSVATTSQAVDLDYSEDDFDVVALRFHFNTASSLGVTVLALYLIAKHSTPAMGAFKYHLLNIQFSALIMDLIVAAYAVPYPLLAVGGFCGAGFITRHQDNFWGQVVPYYVMHYGLAYVGVSLVTGMLYRYLCLMQKGELLHSPKAVFLMAVAVFVLPTPALTVISMGYWPREVSIAYVQRVAPSIAAFYARNGCNTIGTGIHSVLGVVLGIGAIVVVVIFGAIVSYKTGYLLHQHRLQMSAKTFALNKQLQRALWLQGLVPLAVLAVPVLGMMVLYLCGISNLKQFVVTAMQLLATHASCNGLITVFTISPYRNVILRSLSCYCCKRQSEHVVVVRQSTVITTGIYLDTEM